MVLEIRGFGFKESHRTLRLLVKNISKSMQELTLEELVYLRNRMKAKTEKFRYSSSNSVADSFVIDTLRKDEKGIRRRLRNVAPHALFLERGVKPHVVRISNHPKLADWAWNHFGRFVTHMTVGDSKSSIAKGNSKRQFFFNTLDQYLQSSRPDNKFKNALDKAISKSK